MTRLILAFVTVVVFFCEKYGKIRFCTTWLTSRKMTRIFLFFKHVFPYSLYHWAWLFSYKLSWKGKEETQLFVRSSLVLSGGAASFPLASGFILKIHTQPLRFCSAPSSQQKHIFPLTRGGPRARTQILAKKSFAVASFSQESKLKGMKPSGRKEDAAQKCAASLFSHSAKKRFCLSPCGRREKNAWKATVCHFQRGEFVLIGYLFNLHPRFFFAGNMPPSCIIKRRLNQFSKLWNLEKQLLPL